MSESSKHLNVVLANQPESVKKKKKKTKLSPFEIMCKHHPILKKLSPYFNFELLLRKIWLVEEGEKLYEKGETKAIMWIILYGKFDITVGKAKDDVMFREEALAIPNTKLW